MLAGSGSSLAGPLLTVWENEFNRKQSAIRVAYVATNSGEGIRAMSRHAGDFAVGELPLSPEQIRDPNSRLGQIPLGVVAVAPVYNLPGIGRLRFTGELLAQIYMGKVSRWNDSRIAALNPSILLPHLPIVVVHRPEGSGTRYILSDFLSQTSPEFRDWVKAPKREAEGGVEAASGKEMVERVALTPGAIGYVDRDISGTNGLGYGSVQNRAGRFVDASGASIMAACAAKQGRDSSQLPVSLVNAEGEDSYPLVSFSWFYVPLSGVTAERRAAVRQFVTWALQDGQHSMGGLNYFPLPPAVAERARARLRRLDP